MNAGLESRMKGKVICCRQWRIVLEKRTPGKTGKPGNTAKEGEWLRAEALVPILMRVTHSVAKHCGRVYSTLRLLPCFDLNDDEADGNPTPMPPLPGTGWHEHTNCR